MFVPSNFNFNFEMIINNNRGSITNFYWEQIEPIYNPVNMSTSLFASTNLAQLSIPSRPQTYQFYPHAMFKVAAYVKNSCGDVSVDYF